VTTGGQLLADLQHMIFLPSSFYDKRNGMESIYTWLPRKERFQWQFAVVVQGQI